MDGIQPKLNVLLVDDCSGTIGWAMYLESKGMNAIVCDNPISAFPIIEKGGIDVVVSDIYFKGADSDDVEAFIRRCTRKGIGLLICTGAEWDKTPERWDDLTVLGKPCKPQDYCDAVQKCHEENLARKKNGKLRVLIVDDDEFIGTEMPKDLNFFGDFSAKGCTDLGKARAMLAEERFDVVVSDISHEGWTPEDVERFLKDAAGQGIGIMIFSGATWYTPPAIEGLVFKTKPLSYDEYTRSVRKAARCRKVTEISADALHKLANPDRHVETPIMKWERSVLESDSAIPLRALYLEYIRRDIMKASGRGDSKRELDDLMGKLARQEKRMGKG